MRRFIATTAVLLFSATLNAADYVIGLPGALADDPQALYESIGRFILLDMEPGDSLILYDGAALSALGEVAIPEKSAYRHPRVRKRQYLAVLKAVKGHLMALPRAGHSLDVIRFLDHLALNVAPARRADEPFKVLIVGAAEHRDPRAPGFDMGQGDALFPSDAHLSAPLSQSVYSVREKAGRLEGFEVHWLHTTRPGAWANDLYRHRIERFWHLFVQRQGGVLATLTADRDIAFERLQRREPFPARPVAPDHTTGKVEMLRARRQDVTHAPLSEGDAFLEEGVAIAGHPPARTHGYLKIGIRWACAACDIDLYARAGSQAPFLYYANVQSRQGRYNKDFQTAPETANGLEYIAFTAPVDLYDLQVMVNYYAGGSVPGGPQGIVRIFFDGQVYEAPFHIRAARGNTGADSVHARTSAYWDVIDIPAVLGLPRR